MKTRFASRVILITSDDEVLFLKFDRSNIGEPPQYGLPGGEIHENESPSKAAARELFEETGLIKSIHETPDFFLTFPHTLPNGEKTISEEYFFILPIQKEKISHKNMQKDEKEILINHEWVKINNIEKINTSPGHLCEKIKNAR